MAKTYKWSSTVTSDPRAASVISDVYRVMQARLDGYRQSAGAVMIGIFAAVLTIDANFVRLLLDKDALSSLAERAGERHVGLMIVCGFLFVTTICIAGFLVIKNIGKYFSEMTSIVYKIDEANNVWEPAVGWKASRSIR
jgi:hypothetical protein